MKVGDWCRIHSKRVAYDGELALFEGKDYLGNYSFILPMRGGERVRLKSRDEFIILSGDDGGLKALIDFALDIGDREWFEELTLLLKPK